MAKVTKSNADHDEPTLASLAERGMEAAVEPSP
jgi:hypothetical protein